MSRDANEVLEEIRDITLAAKTIAGRLSMRDDIKRLLEQEGVWPQ